MALVRWGIVGTGGIARRMVAVLAEMDDGVAAAVSSNTPERAEAFAAEHGIEVAAHRVDGLLRDADLDAVYIGSTNDRHVQDALACLDAGVPVLLEKPVATDLAGAELVVARARERQVFLMEAMWTRFLPMWQLLVDQIDAGAIGPLRTIMADLGHLADPDPDRRWMAPEQGGGALLDVGIYPVTLACLLAGEPDDVLARDVATGTGVDAQTAAVLAHPGDVLSLLSGSFVSDTGTQALVAGPEGRLRLHRPFHHTTLVTLERGGEVVDSHDVTVDGEPARFEVEEVHRCLAAGATESSRHPLDDTLMVMRTLERIRASAGG